MSKYIVVDHEIEGSSRQERLPVELTNDNKIPAALLQGGGGGAPSIVASFPAEPVEGDQIILTAADSGWPPGRYYYDGAKWINETYPKMRVFSMAFDITSGTYGAGNPYFNFDSLTFVTFPNGDQLFATEWRDDSGVVYAVGAPDHSAFGYIPPGSYVLTFAPTDLCRFDPFEGWGGPVSIAFSGDCSLVRYLGLAGASVPVSGTIDLSTFSNLVALVAYSLSGLTTIDLSTCPKLAYVDLSSNTLSVSEVNAILVQLDTAGVPSGSLNLAGQTPAAAPTGAGATAAANLVAKGWSVTTD